MSDQIQVGCIRCKRTKRTAAMAETAQKTIEDVFEHTFAYISKEAADIGVTIDPQLKAKLLKWGTKQGLFHPDPPLTVEDRVAAERNMQTD